MLAVPATSYEPSHHASEPNFSMTLQDSSRPQHVHRPLDGPVHGAVAQPDELPAQLVHHVVKHAVPCVLAPPPALAQAAHDPRDALYQREVLLHRRARWVEQDVAEYGEDCRDGVEDDDPVQMSG